MNGQQILDNAPEGSTHVDDDFGYWILSEDQNIKSQAWIDRRKGFRSLSIDGFSFRQLSDIQTIVDQQKRIAELEKALGLTNIELSRTIDQVNHFFKYNHSSRSLEAPEVWDKETCHLNEVLLNRANKLREVVNHD